MAYSLNRRNFLTRSMKTLGMLGAAGLAGNRIGAAATPAVAERPDILFLFADDHTFNLIGALGCDEVQTPNLDRLVRQGTSFTNCYNQGGWHGAVCVASRTMLLTGRFLWDAHRTEARLEEEIAAGRLWPQQLKQAGYRTYMSGKWHVQCDPADIFDIARNIRPGMPPDIPEQYNRPLQGQTDPFDPADPALGGFYTGGTHWSEVLGNDGVEFIEDAASREDPFFMYLAFNAPHDPRQSPQAYLDLYDMADIQVPDNFLPEYGDKEAIGCGPSLRDERLAPFPRTEHAVKVQRREYLAIISHMDTQVGRILDALDASGRADNTCIVFSADHGLAVGHHGFMGKQNMYEHSMKAPLVFTGPGIPANRCLDALVYLQDLAPTVLDLAGIPKPDHVDYCSLAPLIAGAADEAHDAIYGAYMDLQRMARKGRHKLIYYPGIDRHLLFDLEADPLEQQNLADDPASQTYLEQMKATLKALQVRVDDPLIQS